MSSGAIRLFRDDACAMSVLNELFPEDDTQTSLASLDSDVAYIMEELSVEFLVIVLVLIYFGKSHGLIVIVTLGLIVWLEAGGNAVIGLEWLKGLHILLNVL